MARRRSHYGAKNSFKRGKYTQYNINKALKAFREIGGDIEETAKRILKDGVDEIVADAKSRCPVYAETIVRRTLKSGQVKEYHYTDPRANPGQLRDSIKAETYNDGESYIISADATIQTKKGALAYGQIVEFSPKINRPFLYPAMEAHRNEIRDRTAQAIRDAVKRKAVT